MKAGRVHADASSWRDAAIGMDGVGVIDGGWDGSPVEVA
jgi:hypothetical protein